MRKPHSLDQLTSFEEAHILQTYMELGQTRSIIIEELIKLIGPLTVRERWDLFDKYGLRILGESFSLEDGAFLISSKILDACVGLGYPATVRLCQVLDEASMNLPDNIKDIYNKFY